MSNEHKSALMADFDKQSLKTPRTNVARCCKLPSRIRAGRTSRLAASAQRCCTASDGPHLTWVKFSSHSLELSRSRTILASLQTHTTRPSKIREFHPPQSSSEVSLQTILFLRFFVLPSVLCFDRSFLVVVVTSPPPPPPSTTSSLRPPPPSSAATITMSSSSSSSSAAAAGSQGAPRGTKRKMTSPATAAGGGGGGNGSSAPSLPPPPSSSSLVISAPASPPPSSPSTAVTPSVKKSKGELTTPTLAPNA